MNHREHLTLSRSEPGPGRAFSLEPHEFNAVLVAVRVAEKAFGAAHFGFGTNELSRRVSRRSLFFLKDVNRGVLLNVENVRPAHGPHTRHLVEILGRRTACYIEHGTSLIWGLVERQ